MSDDNFLNSKQNCEEMVVSQRNCDDECDRSCFFTIKQRLVRVQYPGIVKTLDKALETLGGLSGIERGVAQNKLELNFHPKNKYNKGVIADTNSNSGLLVKIRKKCSEDESTWNYEIVGGVVKNFVFSKFIDFQYLPLVASFPEKHDSETFSIHDSILPDKLPNIQTILSNEKICMPLFLPPTGFSRSDIQKKINPVVKSLNKVESDTKVCSSDREKKLIAFSRNKQPSIFHKFHEPNIPERPTEFVLQLVSIRNCQKYLSKLESLFQERPVWTKNGVRYHSRISDDHLKIILPAVAYYELSGPWRCTWIRFGYDPRKDPESRKYQNLDYRIPYSIRSNLKIGSNRVPQSKILPTSLDKLDSFNEKSSNTCQENSFTLRPNILPTARQVFYQYCDILLPEIQIMLSRLPPASPNTKCDPKIGWFPSSFVDQCREIVGKYIDQLAGSVLRKKRESLPANPLEDLFSRTQKGVEKKTSSGMRAETETTSNDDDFDVFTIYDSDSDDSTGCEQFYQENNLYDLVNELDEPSLCSENQVAELNEIINLS